MRVKLSAPRLHRHDNDVAELREQADVARVDLVPRETSGKFRYYRPAGPAPPSASMSCAVSM
jgi:hypothetical protein